MRLKCKSNLRGNRIELNTGEFCSEPIVIVLRLNILFLFNIYTPRYRAIWGS